MAEPVQAAEEPHDPDRIHSKQDFGRELTSLRLAAGLTVRQVATRSASYGNHSTVGDWFAGRAAPSASSRDLLTRVLAVCGVNEPVQVARWLAAWQRVRRLPGRRPRDPEPYRGLASYQPEHAEWFFGREPLTDDLVERISSRPAGGVHVVVGASGSGKSSLLRAGLVHAVRHTRALGPEWTAALFTPGRRPCDELAAHLADVVGAPAGELADALRAEPEAAASRWMRSGLLLVVDQFEEIITACDDDAERRRFVTALQASAGSGAHVVVGLRADFYASMLSYPQLVTAVRTNQVTVGPMGQAELRRAIVEPARKAGIDIEDGLVELLIAAVVPSGEDAGARVAGGLPLLSHALYATWQHSQDRRLTVADYRAVGGIDQAVATTADSVYEQLDVEERALARRLFLGLVHVAADTVDTRREVALVDLLAQCGGPDDQATMVLDRFVAQRLVTMDADVVGISHEALLTAWPRLRGWLDVDRAGLVTGRQLQNAAMAWSREQRDPAALYRGTRLAVAREWAQNAGPHLSPGPVAREFLQASLDSELAGQLAAHRGARRMRRLVAGLMALLLLTVVAVVFAVRNARSAAEQRDTALAAKVANEAGALRPANPALAAQLGLAAYRLSPVAEAHGALLSTHAAPYATTLSGHLNAVYAADFRPDGAVLATGSLDRSLRLWDVGDPHHPVALSTTTAHGSGVTSLDFGPDGRTVVTASDDGKARLWDVTQPREPVLLATLAGHQAGIRAVAYSPDGRTVATAGYDRTARLWDVTRPDDPVQAATLTGHPEGLCAVTFSPDGHTLVTTSFDATIRRWDVTTPDDPRRLPDLTGHTDRVLTATFAPDGTMLATGGFDNTIRLWDVRDARNTRALATLPGHANGIVSLAFAAGGHTLISGSYDLTIRLWDVTDPAQVSAPATLPGHAGTVYALAVDPRGGTLASGSADNTVRLWDLRRPILSGHNAEVNAVAIDPGRRLLAAGSYLTTRLWDTSHPGPAKATATLAGHTDGVTAVAFRPGSPTLATASLDGTTRLWDVATPVHPEPLARLDLQAGNLFALAFSPDGHTLAVGGEAATVTLWDVRNARDPRQIGILRGHTDAVNAITYSPDGTLLATASSDHTARLWDPATATEIAMLTGHGKSVNAAVFSPDGRLLATAGGDRAGRLWDVRDPRRPAAIGTLAGHSSSVNAVLFSADGRTAATASTDRSVRLWDVSSPARPAWIATLQGHSDKVTSLTFDADGRTLASGSVDATVRLWETDPEHVADFVCSAAEPGITEQEWHQYFLDLPYRPPCG